jgi:hypothetical protein
MAKTTPTPVDAIDNESMNLIGGEYDLSTFFGGTNPWDDYEAPTKRVYEPIPEGLYDAEVVTMEGPVKNKAGDGFYIKAQYRIQDNDPEIDRRTVFQYLSLKPQSKFSLLGTFQALGKVPGDATYTPGEFDGMPCKVQVAIREANGDYPASNSVKWVRSAADEDDASSTSKSLW